MALPTFDGQTTPRLITPVPGERSRAFVDTLANAECPAFTARRKRREEQSGASQDPIVWRAALGANVQDVDGNVYVDLTSGFGAAAIGHTHPDVVQAIQRQASRLVHALGDLHPSDQKIALLERLQQLAPWPGARVVLAQNGSDAVEVALKTAMLFTDKPGVVAFRGAYHGLAHGPLAACGYSDAFRTPFAEQLSPHVEFHDYGADPGPLADHIGAILVEPILGRGGVVEPPSSFMSVLRKRASAAGALLIADEIFTGLGRCGTPFVSGEHADLICIGKALGGGLPISACLGREHAMAAWADKTDGSAGEAIHTGTFFGNPLACAAALACLDVLQNQELGQRALTLGVWMKERLGRFGLVRGRGLMLGLVPHASPDGTVLPLVARLLQRGFITLPAGPHAEVLQLVPPLTIEKLQLEAFVSTLGELL